MADMEPSQDGRNLWRSVYAGGWSRDTAFAEHLTAASPALVRVHGRVFCVHRGPRAGADVRPLRWSSHDPAAARQAARRLATLTGQARGNAETAEVAAARAALAVALSWSPDREIPGAFATESPALASGPVTFDPLEEGLSDEERADELQLRAEILANGLEWGIGVFAEPGGALRRFTIGRAGPLIPVPVEGGPEVAAAPALACFRDIPHLVAVDVERRRIVHLTADRAIERWSPVPDVDLPEVVYEAGESPSELAANLALAVHEDRLHLVFRRGPDEPRLWHAVFDGTSWSGAAPMGPAHTSRRNAALASYDGALHAVFPAPDTDRLRHACYVTGGGWRGPVDIDGHDSRNTPALVAFRDGPARGGQQGLLLIHRGVERYEPPSQPPVPTFVGGGTGERSGARTDYGKGGWSRMSHELTLGWARSTLTGKGLILTWFAQAEYFWFDGYHAEDRRPAHPARVRGSLRLRRIGYDGYVHREEFSEKFSDRGRAEVVVAVPDVEPGTYELTLGPDTHKEDGFWWDGRTHAESDAEEPRMNRWSRVDCHPIRVTVTVPVG